MGNDIIIKGNKKTDITIIKGVDDKLNPYSIYESELKDCNAISSKLNERVDYAATVLSSKLPKELQKDFEIKKKAFNDNIEFVTVPKTEDAYLKHPIKINFKLQFKDAEEAMSFRINGMESLQKEANRTQQPIEVPFISDMKEFLGEYEHPTSFIKNEKGELATLYIMPRQVSPLKLKLEIYNSEFNFEILELDLKPISIDDDVSIFGNCDSNKDWFNFKLKFDTKTIEDGHIVVNVNLQPKKEYMSNIIYFIEYYKYYVLINDKNSILTLKHTDEDKDFFNIANVGKRSCTKKDYKQINICIDLLKKLSFIEKSKKIKLKYYDINEISNCSGYIELLYCDCIKKNVTIKTKTTWTTTYLSDNESVPKSEDSIFNFSDSVKKVKICGTDIHLDKNKTEMFNCKVIKKEEKNELITLIFETNQLKYKFIK